MDKEPKYTTPSGYFTYSDFFGRMPDGRIVKCAGENEYHEDFWEELKNIYSY